MTVRNYTIVINKFVIPGNKIFILNIIYILCIINYNILYYNVL